MLVRLLVKAEELHRRKVYGYCYQYQSDTIPLHIKEFMRARKDTEQRKFYSIVIREGLIVGKFIFCEKKRGEINLCYRNKENKSLFILMKNNFFLKNYLFI